MAHATVRIHGKNPATPGIDPGTFRLDHWFITVIIIITFIVIIIKTSYHQE
jgi:hypothetical protein